VSRHPLVFLGVATSVTAVASWWIEQQWGHSSVLSLCLSGPPPPASRWSLAPVTVGPLVVAAWAYGLRVNARIRCGDPGAWTQAASLAAGIAALAIAFLSPLCRLSASLASAHMVQHALLVTVAPLLLVLGIAAVRKGRSSNLALVTSLYGAAIWLWHLPPWYQAALQSAPVHLLMYVSLLLASLLFWTGIVAAAREGASRAGAAALALLVTLIHTGMLGALLTFSPRIWYPLLATTAPAWGLSALEDQQLAGLIMWVPMGAIYLVAVLWIAAAGLRMLPVSEALKNQS
jgi:cytochrome c oxidase assembly factor CtaG